MDQGGPKNALERRRTLDMGHVSAIAEDREPRPLDRLGIGAAIGRWKQLIALAPDDLSRNSDSPKPFLELRIVPARAPDQARQDALIPEPRQLLAALQQAAERRR